MKAKERMTKQRRLNRQPGESNALIHHKGIKKKKKWITSNHVALPNGEDTLAGVYTCQAWPDKSERKDRRSCLPEPRRP